MTLEKVPLTRPAEKNLKRQSRNAFDQLNAATFQLWVEGAGKSTDHGTGFFISTDGLALTAYHNVKDALDREGRLIKGLYHGQEVTFDCEVPSSLPDYPDNGNDGGAQPSGDIALLKSRQSLTDIQYVQIGYVDQTKSKEERNRFWAGRPACAFGFPLEGDSPEDRFIDGALASPLALYERDKITAKEGWLYFVEGKDTNKLDGNSGAPLFDHRSEKVIGVQHRTYEDRQIVCFTEIGRLVSTWKQLPSHATILPANWWESLKQGFGRFALFATQRTMFEKTVEAIASDRPRLSTRERGWVMFWSAAYVAIFGAVVNLFAAYGCPALGFSFSLAFSFALLVIWLLLGSIVGAAAYVRVGFVLQSALGAGVGLLIGLVNGLSNSANGDLRVNQRGSACIGVAAAVIVMFARSLRDTNYSRSQKRTDIAIVVLVVLLPVVIPFLTTGLPLPPLTIILMTGFLTLSLLHLRITSYPFYSFLCTVAYAIARVHPSWAFPAWKLSPASWDEVIPLKLPFVKKHLSLLLREDRNQAFKELKQFEERGYAQRSASADAVVRNLIIDMQVTTVEDIVNMPRKLAWSTDSPIELPGEVEKALKLFLKISRGVEYGLRPSSLRSQCKSLTGQIENLEEFIRPRRFDSRFLLTATRWLNILQNEKTFLERGEGNGPSDPTEPSLKP